MDVELDTFNSYGNIDQDIVAYRRWHELVINAIGCNSLDALKQCYTPPWSLAGDIEALPIEHRLVPPLVDALLKGISHLGLIKFMMIELKQRLLLPHSGLCRCNLCMALRNDATLRSQYVRKTLKALSSPLYIFNRTTDEDAIQFCINAKQRILDFYATFQPRADYDVGNGLFGYNELSKATFRPMTATFDINNRYECLDQIVNNIDNAVCMILDHCTSDDEVLALLITENKNVSYPNPSPTRMYRKNLRLYRFAKLDMKNTLIHPVSQSVMNILWMNHWQYPSITANLNDPVFRGCLKHVGAPIMFLLSLVTFFIIVPISLILPLPALTFFVKSPRSKYYCEVISEMLFQLFLYTFLYATPLYPYYSVLERICLTEQTSFFTSLHLGLSIILFLFIVGKMLKFIERVTETAGRNVLPHCTNIFFWMEHISYALLLAGFMTEFVWVENTRIAINETKPVQILQCYCYQFNLSQRPFCEMNRFGCPYIPDLNPLNNTLFVNTMGSMLYLSQISDTIIVGGIIFNLISLSFSLSYLHPYLYTIADRLKKCARVLYTVVPIYLVVLFTFAGCIMLLNDNTLDCDKSNLSNYLFASFRRAVWELMWTTFRITNNQKALSPIILPSSTSDSITSIFKMSNEYVLLLYYTFLVITALFFFGSTYALLIEVVKRQSYQQDIKDWMVVHTKKKLSLMCRGCELPIPFNLLHPIYLITSLAMRRTYEHFDVLPRDHGGIGEVFDILQSRNVPKYKETQIRCRTRILSEYMHESPDYSFL